MRFMDQWNHRPTPFVWTAWAQDILAKVERCWRRIAALALASAFATGLRGAQQASVIDANTQAAALEAWRDPALNKKIDDGIEKYRKGDAVLEVVDVGGKPVSGATVRLKQTGHEFLFGSNTFVFGQLKPDEKERRFEEAFLRLFNFTTVPFYWAATERSRANCAMRNPRRKSGGVRRLTALSRGPASTGSCSRATRCCGTCTIHHGCPRTPMSCAGSTASDSVKSPLEMPPKSQSGMR